MHRRFLYLSICLLFVATAATAGGIDFTQDVTGSIATSQTDVDGDGGSTASIGQLGGTSTLGGDITAQTMTELATDPGANTDCAPSEVQFPVVHASAVERFTGLGALLYLARNPAADSFACVDPVTGALNGEIALLIIGGTGPASGATGSATFRFSGVPVGVGVDGPIHTSVTGTVVGTLNP